MNEVNEIINRVKRLQIFEVCATLPECFAFNGRIPFDMQIEGGTAKVQVYAETMEEAQNKVTEYFDGLAS